MFPFTRAIAAATLLGAPPLPAVPGDLARVAAKATPDLPGSLSAAQKQTSHT